MMISNEQGQSVNENLSKKELDKQSHDLTERVKELHCIYSFGILIDTQDISMEGILQGSVDLIPPAWLYSDITCARITAYGMEYTTRKFKKTDWQQSSDIIVHNKCIGRLEIWNECKMSNKSPFFSRKEWKKSLWATCILEKKTIIKNGSFKVPEGHLGISRAIATPIIYRAEVIGNLRVGDKATDYDKNDIQNIETIADHEKDIEQLKNGVRALQPASDTLLSNWAYMAIRIPCLVIKTGRRIVYRFVGYNANLKHVINFPQAIKAAGFT